MKNYKYRLITKTMAVAVIMLGMVGCSDLEEEPVGLLAPESFFKSAADVETSLRGAYGLIASEEYYGRKLVLTLQLRGDMCDIGDRNTPARRQQVNDFNMDGNNGMVTALWPRSYQIISAANATVKGAELIGMEDAKVKGLVAEARFVRAFTYYHLVRLFGDIPYIDYFIDDPGAVKEISKTPEAEVYQGIVSDLEYAVQNLPDSHEGGIRSRPTKATAAAYLSSVHLTLENWQEAYDNAKWVIDNKAQFGLALMDDFAELFDGSKADGLKEHLFSVDFLANVNAGSVNTDWMGPITGIRSFQGVTPNATNEGWSVSVPALEVYSSWDERDYRREVSMIDSGYVSGEYVGYDKFAPNHGSSRPHIGKYYHNCGGSRGDCGVSDNNYVAFRYAEVLLIASEALNELDGSEAEILGYLNEIRARARNWAGTQQSFPADVAPGMSKDALRDLILEERRLELAFEFKRWYDIKRRNLGDKVFKQIGSLEPHNNFDAARDYYLPLPQDELDRNENLKPQNVGY